jgi:hypothetical protein
MSAKFLIAFLLVGAYNGLKITDPVKCGLDHYCTAYPENQES